MSHPFAESKMLMFSDLNTIGGPTREIARSIASNQSLKWVIANEELNISNRRLVLDAIHRSTTIKVLIFWRLNPMDVGIRVDQMRKLEHLYFNDSEIAGVSDTLTSLLHLNRNLQDLQLGGGSMGDTVAQAVERSLRFRSCLSHIYFSSCGLTSNGLASIGRSLQSHSLLKQVTIQEFRLVFRDEAAAVFAQGVEMNTSVEKLNLSVKEMPILGSKLILRAVATSTSLKSVVLSLDELGMQVSFEVARLLAENKILEKLHLSGRNLYVPPGGRCFG